MLPFETTVIFEPVALPALVSSASMPFTATPLPRPVAPMSPACVTVTLPPSPVSLATIPLPALATMLAFGPVMTSTPPVPVLLASMPLAAPEVIVPPLVASTLTRAPWPEARIASPPAADWLLTAPFRVMVTWPVEEVLEALIPPPMVDAAPVSTVTEPAPPVFLALMPKPVLAAGIVTVAPLTVATCTPPPWLEP